MLQLRQNQSLQQRLTPQQVQYLKLLQLPIVALEQRIKSEIEENPMLEELSEEEETQSSQPNDDRVEPGMAEVEATETSAGGEILDASTLDRTALREQEMKKHEDVPQTEDPKSNDYSFEDFMNDDVDGY